MLAEGGRAAAVVYPVLMCGGKGAEPKWKSARGMPIAAPDFKAIHVMDIVPRRIDYLAISSSYSFCTQ
jgi:hypothetical protein